MKELTVLVNMHSSSVDCWVPFIKQMKKHWLTGYDIVIAVDGRPGLNYCVSGSANGSTRMSGLQSLYGVASHARFVDYTPSRRFTGQYLMGLAAINTQYVLTLQDDMLFYGDVDHDWVDWSMLRLNEHDRDCVRLIHSGLDLHYSMQASIWRTAALRKLYASVEFDTPWDAEIGIHRFMGDTNPSPLLTIGGTPRGNHYDNPRFPYIATALVRGKWNREYEKELTCLHTQYGIDASTRGWTE